MNACGMESYDQYSRGVAHTQVTDTPGLLRRPEGERNAMERLTLAALAHLPTAAVFVTDLTGDCGTSVSDQWAIRRALYPPALNNTRQQRRSRA